jgi:hypothetical protein
MDDNLLPIFVVGCAVFGVTIGAAIIALIATDHPDESLK